ncbi:M48 family metallopeptidase [Prevotella sp. KH2C16]|uniref:tetratricopeptide repeat protein n=1 Tax=Prevotella sp. KH2C16 TaxID=1855325 RepID=UPI0008EB1B80|nr:hypothetical protein [Prevotella sp. KH2C16]SFF83684.1 hypothetical protein SAMN05216383_101141 [Prevotella sp. KH2C16]
MKLFTLIVNFIYGNRTYQISANSIREALHQLFDTREMEGVGPKALRQLHADIDSELWKPSPYMDMTNTWVCQYRVNNEDMYINIVKTDEQQDPDEPSEHLEYSDGFYTAEQGHRIMEHCSRLEEKDDWKALKRYATKMSKLYPREYYLMTKVAKCCYFLEEPEEMLQWARKAYEEWSEDPYTSFWLALALYENGRWQEAIRHSDTILYWDFRNLAYGRYGEDADYARQLIDDCKAIKGLSLLALNQAGGTALLREYLAHAKASASYFKKSWVRSRLKEASLKEN